MSVMSSWIMTSHAIVCALYDYTMHTCNMIRPKPACCALIKWNCVHHLEDLCQQLLHRRTVWFESILEPHGKDLDYLLCGHEKWKSYNWYINHWCCVGNRRLLIWLLCIHTYLSNLCCLWHSESSSNMYEWFCLLLHLWVQCTIASAKLHLLPTLLHQLNPCSDMQVHQLNVIASCS